jgi:hypothetical protein
MLEQQSHCPEQHIPLDLIIRELGQIVENKLEIRE